ncbi:metal-dependent hydrolase [Kribbella sp. NBC_00662]|uniref:metal-dependent hydrolase n=1 Tax=Kribbella sp. NBC_00662 TaxID=2975969 RepID=UPI00324B5743
MRGVRLRMMGRSHALSGWCAGLAVAPLVGLTSVAEVVPFAAATAGYALLPDLDHPGASASRLLGPVTRLVSGAVRAFSGVLYNLTKGPRDEDSTGKHRHATHTLAAAILLGFLAANLGDRGKWAVLAVAVTGLVLAADALGDWIILAVLATAGWSVVGTADPLTPLPGTAAADAVQAGLSQIGSWIGVAVALGMFVHCLGDSLTRSGCPWLWPLPIRGETWYELRLPRPFRFSTDSWVERLVIAPLLLIAGVLLLPGALPALHNLFAATSIWLAGQS